jgi:hypothetical protein
MTLMAASKLARTVVIIIFMSVINQSFW